MLPESTRSASGVRGPGDQGTRGPGQPDERWVTGTVRHTGTRAEELPKCYYSCYYLSPPHSEIGYQATITKPN